MEAIAFPDGALFAVATVEVLTQHTSHHVQPAADHHGQPVSLHVQREEFQLRLSMPRANAPLHLAGTLTVGELVLATTLTELQPTGDSMVAHAVGIHERITFPTA